MRVYVAAFFDDRERIRQEALKLWDKGYDVISSWLNEVSKPEHMSKEDFWKKLALKDIAEVKSSNLIILDTLEETPRGGREVEFGFGLAQHQDKSIYLVGPVRNVFHTLADRRYATWKELLKDLPSLTGKSKINDNPKVTKKKKSKKK